MCEHLEATVRAVFDRAGTPVPPGADALDEKLARTGAIAGELLRRAVEDEDGGPVQATADLLTCVAALRQVLGYAPIPVNAEVFAQGE